MRPRDAAARERLAGALSRRAGSSAAELASELGVSVPTLHRILHEQGASVIATGKARRARYAWRRPLRGEAVDVPLYRVDAQGRAAMVGQLALIRPEGSSMQLPDEWPVPEASRDGWWGGLPYPLFDMRPQGYLGRQLARAQHRALGVAPQPDAWSDDDVVLVLSRLGHDVSGDLILGDPAFEHWQAGKLDPPEPIRPRSIGTTYGRLAAQAVAAGVAGSSAAGEFPKFTAVRDAAGALTPHVLVKFSGAEDSGAVQRWADLLVCEHLALECARTLRGVESPPSRIVVHAGRTFLEVERFDRHGPFGRSPLVSLATIDAAWLGEGAGDWGRLARRLEAAGLLGAAAVPGVDRLAWFGRLIANTDMHLGNLSFRPCGRAEPFEPAPAYDMLPMLYAPLPGGEIPARTFEPAMPLPPQRNEWLAACAAAIEFWHRASRDARIGARFRAICGVNAQALERTRDAL